MKSYNIRKLYSIVHILGDRISKKLPKGASKSLKALSVFSLGEVLEVKIILSFQSVNNLLLLDDVLTLLILLKQI